MSTTQKSRVRFLVAGGLLFQFLTGCNLINQQLEQQFGPASGIVQNLLGFVGGFARQALAAFVL